MMSLMSAIDISSNSYSKFLKEIPHDPPRVLHCRGDSSLLLSHCLAIVGTRAMTNYGKDLIRSFIPELAKHFTIVSGLALGVDAAVHEATLASGGRTIAVLPAGVEDKNVYPKRHLPLAQEILNKGGLLISEHQNKYPIERQDFPVRNRIVSGISLGTFIIEADVRSGSLVTARLALEQNRDVFAAPGNVFSDVARGVNHLIKNGAKLVSSPQDIIEEYEHILKA